MLTLIVGYACPDRLEHPSLVAAVFENVDAEVLQDAGRLGAIDGKRPFPVTLGIMCYKPSDCWVSQRALAALNASS